MTLLDKDVEAIEARLASINEQLAPLEARRAELWVQSQRKVS